MPNKALNGNNSAKVKSPFLPKLQWYRNIAGPKYY